MDKTEAAIELYETLSQGSSQRVVSISHSGSGSQIYFGGDQARVNLIKAYRSAGKLDDLLAHLEQDLETDTDNPTTLEIIADIHRTGGDDAKAAESYHRLCKVQPGNVRSFYYAAAAFNKSGQPELAQQLLNEGEVARSANTQWGQDRWSLIAIGGICIKGELYDAAIQLLESATANSRGSGDNYHLQMLNHTLAQAYLGAERYAEAAEAFQQLANFSGRNTEMKKLAEEGLLKAYRDGNLAKELLEEGTQTITENPDDPDTHMALGRAYELKDQPDEAIAAYERARGLDANNPDILEPLAKLYTNTAPEKAKPLYKQLIKLADNPNARIQNRRALIELYKRQGEFDTAITELIDTVHFATEQIEHSVALRSLWDIYTTQERTADGIATLEELAIAAHG